MGWIVSQIGCREHYAVPRAFESRGQLERFYTDVWCRHGSELLQKLPAPWSRLAGRFHPMLPSRAVSAFNFDHILALARGALSRSGGLRDDEYRNYITQGRAFASAVAADLRGRRIDPRSHQLFCFSTGALETLQFAREIGMTSVVDQLDPARMDEEIVCAEMAKWPGWEPFPGNVPVEYYDRLAEEWSVADTVLVNSGWSRDALIKQKVPAEKIVVVPLAYEPEPGPSPRARQDTTGRPLTVLWLGQVVLRKGIPYFFEAARRLQSSTIRFIVAGRIGISQTGLSQAPKNVTILGQVSRLRALELFAEADVFVLPTMSDGFALTQLEAMSFGLPVIASQNCGEVVTDGVDGLIIPAGDAGALTAAIEKVDRDRGVLLEMSKRAMEKPKQFSLEAYTERVDRAVRESNAADNSIATQYQRLCNGSVKPTRATLNEAKT